MSELVKNLRSVLFACFFSDPNSPLQKLNEPSWVIST